jgi:hypothetical protein
LRSARAYARYREPFAWVGRGDFGDGSVLRQQSPGSGERDAGYRAENCFWVGRAPRTSWDVATDAPPLAFAQKLQPKSRVVRIRGSKHRYADLGERKKSASNGLWSECARVEVVAFDEKAGMRRDRLQAGHLPPEPTIDDRKVQIANTLPFDEYAADFVVPKPQSPTNESHLEPPQRIQHPTLPLVYVHDKELPHDEILHADRAPH